MRRHIAPTGWLNRWYLEAQRAAFDNVLKRRCGTVLMSGGHRGAPQWGAAAE